MPQDPNDIWPLLLVMLAVGGVVLMIDFALLIRWFIYQLQLSRMEASAMSPSPYSTVASPAPPEAAFTGSSDRSLDGSDLDLDSASGAVAQDAQETAKAVEETSPQKETPYAPSEPVMVYSDYPTPTTVSSPFAPRWSLVHPFLGVQFVILAANMLAVIPILIPIIFALTAGGMPALQKPGFTQNMQSAINYSVVFGTLMQNVLFVGVVAWCLQRYGTSLREIGLRRPTQQQILLGVGLGLALFVVAFGVETGVTALLHKTLPAGIVQSLEKMTEAFSAGTLFQHLPNFWLKAGLFVAGAVAAPIGEEVFFRGLLYNALKARFNVLIAIILSGLLFALIHFGPLAIVVIFPMGMLLAYVYERTNSLWITILMHAINNGLALGLVWIFPQWGK